MIELTIDGEAIRGQWDSFVRAIEYIDSLPIESWHIVTMRRAGSIEHRFTSKEWSK